MQEKQPQATQGELIARATAGVDLRTLSLEAFVEIFVERLKKRPDVLELSAKALDAAARASQLVAGGIKTPGDYATAFNILGEIAALVSDSEEKRKEITRPIDAAKKRVMEVFAPDADILGDSNRVLRVAAGAYKDAQDRKEREERERAEAAARAERQRLEREAEARRKAADEDARKKREEADRLAAEGKHREAARIAAAADAVVEKADAAAVNLERRADSVVAAPVAAQAPKVAGVSNREVWDFEVLDPRKIKPLFLCPDEAKIRAVVRQHKRDAVELVGEGIRVFPTTDFNVKKKR